MLFRATEVFSDLTPAGQHNSCLFLRYKSLFCCKVGLRTLGKDHGLDKNKYLVKVEVVVVVGVGGGWFWGRKTLWFGLKLPLHLGLGIFMVIIVSTWLRLGYKTTLTVRRETTNSCLSPVLTPVCWLIHSPQTPPSANNHQLTSSFTPNIPQS